MDENLASVQLFKDVVDSSIEEIAPYLLQLLHKIIVPCFLKHSKRPYAKDVNGHNYK